MAGSLQNCFVRSGKMHHRPFCSIMLHRHLDPQSFSLAAIDDVIARGRWRDWADLRRAALSDRTLLDKVQRI